MLGGSRGRGLGAASWAMALAVGGAALAQGVPGPSGDAKQLGTLTCTASAPTSDPQVPASKETQFACTFEPIGTEGVKEYYVGSSTRAATRRRSRRQDDHRLVGALGKPGSHAGDAGGNIQADDWRGRGQDPDRRGRKRLHTAAAYRSRPERGVPTALDTLVLRRDRPRV